MNFIELSYDEQTYLIAQYITAMSTPDHGDSYIAIHPELKKRDVVIWVMQQARMFRDQSRLLMIGPSTLPPMEKMELANQKFHLSQNLAAAAFSLGGELQDYALGAEAADFIAMTAEESGDGATAQRWRMTAMMFRES